MPGRRVVEIDKSLCRRCQTRDPAITIRTEPLCSECFSKYVTAKVVKRMETFRVRHSEPGKERTLLLPLSCGSCSLALLHILSQHLKGQVEKTGRTGFKLHVLHVDLRAVQSGPDCSALFEETKQYYPQHEYSAKALEDVAAEEDLSSLLPTDEQVTTDTHVTSQEALTRLFERAPSATSRADLLDILLRKLTISFAKAHNCEAVIWGDSTTRLAERTLAETAKGRGFSLPWIVADGESPHGVPFYYPLRELLGNEVAAYVTFVEPPLTGLLKTETVKASIVSAKNTTIDDLMQQYFTSVERDYPSIVTNVVRTTGKLKPLSLSAVESQCELCEMPLDGLAPEKSRLCYGCIRTLPQAV